MNILKLFSNIFRKRHTEKSQCHQCVNKICCVVFDVINFKGQGRIAETIKEAWVPCKYLNSNGQCDNYANRCNTCYSYNCNNLWPLLSEWITVHKIDIITHSREIAFILLVLEHFLHENRGQEDYKKRYNFLQDFLKSHHFLDEIIEKIQDKNFLKKNFEKESKS